MNMMFSTVGLALVAAIFMMLVPIALLVVGASFSGSEALKRWKSAAVSSFVKLRQ